MWYIIPPKYGRVFEDKADLDVGHHVLHKSKPCPAMFRHKDMLVTPEMMKRHGIPLYKVIFSPVQIKL